MKDVFDMTMGDAIEELEIAGFLNKKNGVFTYPDRALTDRENEVCDYLFNEWDCYFESPKEAVK